jgi:sporulation protein YlmC with PRC-barrel domain
MVKGWIQLKSSRLGKRHDQTHYMIELWGLPVKFTRGKHFPEVKNVDLLIKKGG